METFQKLEEAFNLGITTLDKADFAHDKVLYISGIKKLEEAVEIARKSRDLPKFVYLGMLGYLCKAYDDYANNYSSSSIEKNGYMAKVSELSTGKEDEIIQAMEKLQEVKS